MKEPIEITAVWLRSAAYADGAVEVLVEVSIDGKRRFVELMNENLQSGPVSHIYEANGIRAQIKRGKFDKLEKTP